MSQTDNKKRFLNHLQNAIGFAVIVWFIWYLWDHKSLFESAKTITLSQALSLTVLYILTLILTSAQGHILFKKFSHQISWHESLTLTLATSFGNYLPMRAGTVMRARYMKSLHNLDYTKFGSIFSVRLALIMMASGLCGLIALLNIDITVNTIPLLGVFLVIVVFPLLVMVFSPKQKKEFSKTKLLRLWQRFTNGIHELKSDLSTTAICFTLVVLQLVLLGLRFWISANILNKELDTPTLMLMVSIANIASFTAITPGALGVRESLMGYATLATGETFSKGLLIGSVERVVTLIVIALFGGFSFIKIWVQLNKFSNMKTNP